MNTEDYQTTAIIAPGLTICGIPPKKRLVTLDKWPCENCNSTQVVRIFSGSGWYEDDRICRACGESGTGYRPFKRAWRAENITRANTWIGDHGLIPYEEFQKLTGEIVREEMSWDDEPDAD